MPPLLLPALAAAAVTLFEAALLQRTGNIFTGGYLKTSHLQGVDVGLFFAGSFLLDAALVAPVAWLAAVVLGRIGRLNRSQKALVAWGVACIPLGVANFMRFRVAQFLGNTIEFSLLRTLAGGNYATMLSVASSYLLGLAVVLLPMLAVFAAALWALGRWPRGKKPPADPGRGVPTWRAGLLGTALLLGASGGLLVAATYARETVFGPLRAKVSGGLLAAAFNELSDLDRDGHGLVLAPRDHAPFDARRYPYAVDLPGNGIDENGIGGDLAARGDFAGEAFGPVTFAQHPDVIVLVLESFRRDNVGARVDGKPVTPVLERLVAEGAVLGDGYSHSAFTVGALKHLLLGGLAMTQPTSLIDDFRSNGYLTACISGQNELFGDIKTATGMDRAEYYADATSHTEERTYAFSPQGVLIVPWTVVLRDLGSFLQKHGGERRPIFLYMNLQDCHFPYQHYALKPLVAADTIPRSEIYPENAARLQRVYRNTAANVDMAVGEALAEITKVRGRRPAFIIVGDHGESLFERGVLGHGIAMMEEQHRIPVIVGGLPAACTFPMGLSEVRGLVRDALAQPPGAAGATPGPPVARTDPKKSVFLYIGNIDAPASIGQAAAGGATSYHFRTGRLDGWGAPADPPDATALLRFWEQLVLYRHEAGHAAPQPLRKP